MKSPAVEIHRGFNCGFKANVCKEMYQCTYGITKPVGIYDVYEGCNPMKQDLVVLFLFRMILFRSDFNVMLFFSTFFFYFLIGTCCNDNSSYADIEETT